MGPKVVNVRIGDKGRPARLEGWRALGAPGHEGGVGAVTEFDIPSGGRVIRDAQHVSLTGSFTVSLTTGLRNCQSERLRSLVAPLHRVLAQPIDALAQPLSHVAAVVAR